MSIQEQFLLTAAAAAKAAGHPFPDYAACEAALESGWGNSRLALEANNLFGQKQSHPPLPGTTTLTLPTREFLRGQWVTVAADWVVFPTVQACFESRIALLKRLAPGFPNYKLALAATTGEQFVTLVSKSWSTDPGRAGKVLATHDAHASIFAADLVTT
jgi:flagellum-specific peptidoglycan hydrolase FlgJ